MTDVPTLPTELQVPRFRFWGDKQPPKNKAEIFSVRTAKNAAAAAGSVDGGSQVTGSIATMRIYGPIDSWGGWWGISAKDVATALDALPDDVVEVRVRINSPGGEVWEGMAILNLLRAHKARAVAVVDGLAASAASVIAVGCEETVMSPGTQLMIHDASAFAYGPAETMQKAARFLDSVSNAIASIYTESAGGTDADWRAVMVEETWYTAQEAADANLADRVAVVQDAGETSTAGDEPEPEVIVVLPEGEDPEDRFDLSIFNHAGRSHAPAPTLPTASADGPTQKEGATLVDFTDEQIATLRAQVGFPDDADAETIVAAVAEALEERAEPAPTTSAQVPEGLQLVDSTVLAQMQANATQGREAREQQLRDVRDAAIAKAIATGRTTPARRDHWRTAWDADPEGTAQVLAALQPGLIPLDEIGNAGGDPTGEASADDQLYDSLFPEQQKGA